MKIKMNKWIKESTHKRGNAWEITATVRIYRQTRPEK